MKKVQMVINTVKWGSIILIKLKTQLTQMKKVKYFTKIHKNGVNDFDHVVRKTSTNSKGGNLYLSVIEEEWSGGKSSRSIARMRRTCSENSWENGACFVDSCSNHLWQRFVFVCWCCIWYIGMVLMWYACVLFIYVLIQKIE